MQSESTGVSSGRRQQGNCTNLHVSGFLHEFSFPLLLRGTVRLRLSRPVVAQGEKLLFRSQLCSCLVFCNNLSLNGAPMLIQEETILGDGILRQPLRMGPTRHLAFRGR
jgi:hypothetical protein